ncbi:MAG TPA: DUF819 family protein [Bacteroidales bacterium]|nr:DUF819 family protein [Bacteroidales bacterium]HRZ49822.1 DUF819 family protein [Bacteroidales bacterium]
MVTHLILILFFLLAPAGILYLCQKVPFLAKIGAIVLAYVLGFLVGNIGIIDPSFSKTQQTLSEVMVMLAIPLLLFSLRIRSWIKVSGKTFMALLLGVIALVVMIASGHRLFGEQVPESWKVAGMLTGVYSGGTPNLASIKEALQVTDDTYILTHTYDIVMSTAYLFFLITIGKVLFRRFLPRFHSPGKTGEGDNGVQEIAEDYTGIFKAGIIGPLLGAVGISVLILAAGFGLSTIVPKDYSTVVAILSITTFGILLSMVPAVSRIKKSFETGMYFILVFSLVVASLADFSKFNIESLNLMLYVGYAVFGTLFLHVLLAKLFRIDADTTIITSVSMIFSPPFVPMVAGALKNKEIILSGLITGLIGYAIGNYLGITIAYLLK